MATKEQLLSQSSVWEYSLIKISYEVLSKFVRTSQRALSKEIQVIVDNIHSLSSKPSLSKEQALKELNSYISRLQEIKQRMVKASAFESDQLASFQKRLDHAMVPARIVERKSSQSIEQWYDIRLARVIMDYLLREGFQKTAHLLYESEHLEDLIDSKMYLTIGKVIEGLDRCDCTPALKWCGENRTRLAKNNVSDYL